MVRAQSGTMTVFRGITLPHYPHQNLRLWQPVASIVEAKEGLWTGVAKVVAQCQGNTLSTCQGVTRPRQDLIICQPMRQPVADECGMQAWVVGGRRQGLIK